MVWKLIITDSQGNESVYGGNDILKIMKLFSGYDLKTVDPTDGVSINTDTSFGSEKFSIMSPSTGFKYIFKGKEIVADRIISLPLMGGDGEISLTASGSANDWGAFMQTFRHQNIKIMNPANSFGYLFNSSAITANRNITFPLLTADDAFVFSNAVQTLTNKTLTSPTISAMTVNTDSNTIKHSTTNNNGDLLVNTGTKFDRFARGGADQVPIMNSTGTGLTWIDKTSLTGSGGGGPVTGDYQVPKPGNIITGAWYATPAGPATAAGSGVWSSFLESVSTVTPSDLGGDPSGRMGSRYNFTADDDRAGFRTINTHFTRLNDPELYVRYKYISNGANTDYRIVMGFTTDPLADYGTGTGALDSKSAFMWFKEIPDSIIQVGLNDGDSSQNKDSTVSLSATNESVNTIRLFGDSANNRFGISLNGANASYLTTEIPAATTRLGVIVQIENEDASDRSCEFYGAYFKAKVI